MFSSVCGRSGDRNAHTACASCSSAFQTTKFLSSKHRVNNRIRSPSKSQKFGVGCSKESHAIFLPIVSNSKRCIATNSLKGFSGAREEKTLVLTIALRYAKDRYCRSSRSRDTHTKTVTNARHITSAHGRAAERKRTTHTSEYSQRSSAETITLSMIDDTTIGIIMTPSHHTGFCEGVSHESLCSVRINRETGNGGSMGFEMKGLWGFSLLPPSFACWTFLCSAG